MKVEGVSKILETLLQAWPFMRDLRRRPFKTKSDKSSINGLMWSCCKSTSEFCYIIQLDIYMKGLIDLIYSI